MADVPVATSGSRAALVRTVPCFAGFERVTGSSSVPELWPVDGDGGRRNAAPAGPVSAYAT